VSHPAPMLKHEAGNIKLLGCIFDSSAELINLGERGGGGAMEESLILLCRCVLCHIMHSQ
jgi:hypothetical protein